MYKLAKAATAQPEGVVREVIYPVVSEETLEDVIREAEADEKHEQQVKLVTRSSYSHHYRRVVPVLLDVLSFQCNNERHRPVMDALALLKKHRGRKSPVFPFSEKVPLNGVAHDDWQDLLKDDKHAGAVNRISYEWCVLTTLPSVRSLGKPPPARRYVARCAAVHIRQTPPKPIRQVNQTASIRA